MLAVSFTSAYDTVSCTWKSVRVIQLPWSSTGHLHKLRRQSQPRLNPLAHLFTSCPKSLLQPVLPHLVELVIATLH